MNRLLPILLLLLWSASAMATHNRAGEITYRHLSGFTYEATITTCTKTSVIADREFLGLSWGDGIIDTLQRESITNVIGMDAQVNVYVGTHTYAGPGQFLMQMIDPNRNAGVINIDGSVDLQFAIQSLLIISPATGHNNSVQLLNPAKEQACLYKVWQHNPGAYDPDGDILKYSLIPCLGADINPPAGIADPIVGYEFPDEATDDPTDVFWIDENTGTVTWDVVQMPVGEYNIAILIEEFRMVDGVEVKVGHVIRDMQITITICDNDPPVIDEVQDTCVVAFTNLSFQVTASDPNGDVVNISATGGPLTQVEQPAFFTPTGSGQGSFSWTPTCTEVRLAPYQMLFSASDVNLTVSLTTFMTMNITVIAPPVQNPTVEPDGNSFILNWDTHQCVNALSNSQVNNAMYKIYRRQGAYGFQPDHCETGVPEYTGYELIGEVQGLNNTSYVDTEGVFYGGEFCYMIVMCLPDGSESIASEEFCAEIIKDTPVMTNVSVNSTDATNGEIYIAWSPASEMDTDNFPGPYYYEVYHGNGNPNAGELIYTSAPSADLFNEDTTFTHSGINTLDLQHFYRVNLYSGDDFVGSSVTASSIFLELEGDDNQITLFMNYNVPWNNQTYDVYRRGPDDAEFTLLASTEDIVYTDTGLPNNEVYCYYVTSNGSYNNPGTIDPIINDSQENCGIAVDLTPPCIPTLTAEGDCETEEVYLTWTNPNNSCEETDDTAIYHLWFSPTEDGELSIIATITDANDTTFVFNEDGEIGSIAGCYAVTALDSLTPGINGELRRNESGFSEIFCIDNCPEYSLPNIFSPNNDGVNDVFTAFPWKFIESVQFYVYNRWGGLVFETTDPHIKWDGTDFETGEICTDGTYFYVARVNTIRLSGIVPIELTGTINIVGGRNPFRED